METVGNKIRMQRLIKNYSQEYMAFMLEISQPAYSKIERDETEISLRRLYEIAEVLEISASSLMPPSKYGTGINYLRIRQAILKYSRFWKKKLSARKQAAQKLDMVYSDKSNSPDK